MVDSISQKPVNAGTIKIARLKVGDSNKADTTSAFSLSASETQLSELAKINPAIRERVEKGRKLDAFLRLASQILGVMNGKSSTKVTAPQFSKINIEYVELKNPYSKTDKTV